MTTSNSPQLSSNILIFYRTFLAFIIGYFCTQLFNLNFVIIINSLGLAKAESLALGAMFSIIFAIIFVFTCYIINSLKKLSYIIITLTFLLLIIRFLLIQ